MQDEATYVGSIIQGIVSFPDEVRIDRTSDERGILLTLTVAKQDMGKVIGRNGDNINAVRRIAKAFGAARKAAISIKINDYEN